MIANRSSGPWFLVISLALAVSRAVAKPGQVKILCASAPRSGTQSLAFALQRLGVNAMHTGNNWTSRTPLCESVDQDVLVPAAVEFFDSYDAILDEPVQLLFRQFLKQYPDGKVILTQRDPEKWYLSWARLWINVAPFMLGQWPWILHEFWSLWRLVQPNVVSDWIRYTTCKDTPYKHCGGGCYWGCDWHAEQTPAIQEACKAGYAAHNAAVLETVPAEQLLVWSLSEGWAPLCKFLGVSECPIGESFPHVDFQTPFSFVQTPVVEPRPPVVLPKNLPLVQTINVLISLVMVFGPWLLVCCCCRVFGCCCFRKTAAADEKKRA